MADFSVSTMFKAIDKVSKVFGKQSRAAIKFGDKATRAFNKASRSGNKFGSVLKGVLGANVIGRGFGLIARGVRNVINEFIDFDDAIVSASAKFKGLNLATKQGQATFEKLKKTARDVGGATQFTTSQAAGGLDFLALAGKTAERAMALLPGVVDLATVANIDLARATDISTDSLNAFGLQNKDASIEASNFARLNDVLAFTMSRTNTDIEQLFESIKKGATVLNVTGQSMETFTTLSGILANSALKGTDAGTLLRNTMLSLAGATGPAQDALDKLNVKVADKFGNFRDIVDILEDIEKGKKKFGEVEGAALIKAIFEKRGIAGIEILLKKGSKELRKFRDETIAATGSAQSMADIMRTSLGNRLKALNSAFIELGFRVLEAFDKRGRKGIDSLTEAIRKFDVTPIIEGIESIVGLFKDFKTAIDFLPLSLSGLVKGLIAIKVAMWAVNIAMLANPVGIVLVAVGVLVGLLALLVLNWDSVVATLESGANKIGKFFANMWDIAKASFFSFITPILKIISKIGNFFGLDTQSIDFLNVEKTKQKSADAFNSILDRNSPISQKRIAEIKSQGGLRLSSNIIQPPNQTEVEARQQIGFVGQIDINGAPSGTTVKSKTTGAPPINMNLAGAN